MEDVKGRALPAPLREAAFHLEALLAYEIEMLPQYQEFSQIIEVQSGYCFKR